MSEAGRRLRVAFFGSPEWAVPVLERLAARHQVALVITQPDKPQGRGLHLGCCAVAARASELALPLMQPTRFRKDGDFFEYICGLRIDVVVTAAYGRILPRELLEVPRLGFLNIHPSLLPRYRGPAPVQWTLINGDEETGVSLMRADVGVDTGPLAAQWRTRVDPHEEASELSTRLRDRGVALLLEVLEHPEEIPAWPQSGEASYAPMLTKEDGRVCFERTARDIYNRYRGVRSWPGSWLIYQGRRIKVLEMYLEEGYGQRGKILKLTAEGLQVAAEMGTIRLMRVQPEGGKPMLAAEWARGARISVGDSLL